MDSAESMKLIGLPPIFSLARLMQKDHYLKNDDGIDTLMKSNPFKIEEKHALSSFTESLDGDFAPILDSNYTIDPKVLSAFLFQFIAGSRLSSSKDGGIHS